MTRAQVLSAIYDLVGVNSSYARLTSTQAYRYADEAQNILAYEAYPLTLRSTHSANLVADTATYVGPASMLVDISCKSNGRQLERSSPEALDTIDGDWENATSSATQSHYFIGSINTSGGDRGKFNITLWPTPSGNVSSGLLLRYLRQPSTLSSDLSDSDEIIDFPAHMHDAIALYAAWRHLRGLAESVTDADRVNSMKSEWDYLRGIYVAEQQQWASYVDRKAIAQQAVRQ